MSHHYLGDGWPPENASYQNFDNQYYQNQIPNLQSQSPGTGYGRGTTATPRYGPFDPMPYGQYGESSLASGGIVTSAMSSPAMLHSHHQYSLAPMEPNRYAPVPIAPNPSGLEQMNHAKRMREEALQQHASQKRRRSSPLGNLPVDQRPSTSPYLTEEEQLLLKLKQDERLPWKEIAHRFELAFNRTFQVPALQMRYKRLREKMRTWTEDDVQALEKAYNYWEESKFDIIAQKMMEFGASEKWPARLCEKKWLEMHPQPSTHPSSPLNLELHQPPPLSEASSLLIQPRQHLPRTSDSPFKPPSIPPLPTQTLPSNSGRSSPTIPPLRPQPQRTYSNPTHFPAPQRQSHPPTMAGIKPPESENFEMPGLATTIFSAVPYPQQPPRPRRPP